MNEDLNMRALAFVALDEERQYQQALAADETRPDIRNDLTLGEHILAMHTLMEDIRLEWYLGSGDQTQAMNTMRKITALGLSAMENHGVVRRTV